MILATFQTPSFTFHVLETDAEHARRALDAAWKVHVEQTGADPNYLREYAGDITYSDPFTFGVVLRDGRPVEPAPVDPKPAVRAVCPTCWRHVALLQLDGTTGWRHEDDETDMCGHPAWSDSTGAPAGISDMPLWMPVDEDDDKQTCGSCGDDVYCLSSRGLCDGCEAEAETADLEAAFDQRILVEGR